MSQLERIVFIDQRIKSHGGIRVREIVERFEISERHAKRDIEYLKDRFNAPISWNRGKGCYLYTERYHDLDFLDERALLFYVFARSAAGTLAYVPVAAEKALDHLRDLVSKDLKPLADAVRYQLTASELVSDDFMSVFLHAILDKKVVDIWYKDAENKESTRGIEPRKMINYSGIWYCVAFDHSSEDLRTFRLSRIARVSISKLKWKGCVAEEKNERFVDSSYGMFKGAGDKKASVRFYGWARGIVSSETWHPEEVKSGGTDPVRGDYVQLDIPVSRWEEILGRTLRFGSMAEAAAPEEFRSLWVEEIRRMSEAAGISG
jgi:predicted DNA-binding transcriptional regulator YafY